jgi:hypothetical protein
MAAELRSAPGLEALDLAIVPRLPREAIHDPARAVP